MLSHLVVLQVNGEQLLATLSNGVCQYPALEGRFCCVSGVKFNFDPNRPPNDRVLRETVTIRGKPLDLAKTDYTLVTTAYLVGHDGYTELAKCPVLVDEENLTSMATCVSRYFMMQQAASKFANAGSHQHAVEATVKLAAGRLKKCAHEHKHEDGHEGSLGSAQKSFKLNTQVEGRVVNAPQAKNTN